MPICVEKVRITGVSENSDSFNLRIIKLVFLGKKVRANTIPCNVIHTAHINMESSPKSGVNIINKPPLQLYIKNYNTLSFSSLAQTSWFPSLYLFYNNFSSADQCPSFHYCNWSFNSWECIYRCTVHYWIYILITHQQMHFLLNLESLNLY